ncbi:MAG: FAD-dependent oxidoreductase [Deltaproteobacteria bacterium]|nr:FAD-dependent oxidoreductase [Deltaproteobacteria bacterium]
MGELTSLLEGGRAEEALPDKKPLYSEAEARAEAERCLYCTDAPCIQACPTEIDIPTFIKKIASGNVRGSARTILEQNLLGYSCSRVCPVEELCAGSCVYVGWGREPIAIGRLQRFATETVLAEPTKSPGLRALYTPKPKIGKRVACIGGGPASLAFAGYLALEGVDAVVLEKRAIAGGLNATGIAPYKLHAAEAVREVEWVLDLGIELRRNVSVGEGGVRGAQLLTEYDAVFVGVGLGEDSRLGVPGEDGPGVIGAVDWIERMKLDPKTDKPRGRVVVVGGGNTAIDVARECAQLGAQDVVMVYRRTRDAMSGYAHELAAARKEGVRLLEQAVPVEVIRRQGALVAVRLARTEGGRPVPGTEWELACDQIIVAIGQSKLRAIAGELPGVELDAKGCVVADAATGQTGNPRVFAGGDCVNGGKEVVNAVADGRNAARHLIAQWKGSSNG